MSIETKSWNEVKGKIITRYGSITEIARHLRCSTEAVRKSMQGKCPKVRRRLEAALR